MSYAYSVTFQGFFTVLDECEHKKKAHGKQHRDHKKCHEDKKKVSTESIKITKGKGKRND